MNRFTEFPGLQSGCFTVIGPDGLRKKEGLQASHCRRFRLVGIGFSA